jgi:hypothetical protein
VRSKGRFFDLNALFDQVNREYFANEIDCPITWGANRRVRNQNSIKLASYSDRTKTIRVHPALDKSYVPKYVIMGIVYHEMLHHHLGVEHRNGRKTCIDYWADNKWLNIRALRIRPHLRRKSAGVVEHCEISKSKHQITNKSQIPILNDQNKKQVWNLEFWSL